MSELLSPRAARQARPSAAAGPPAPPRRRPQPLPAAARPLPAAPRAQTVHPAPGPARHAGPRCRGPPLRSAPPESSVIEVRQFACVLESGTSARTRASWACRPSWSPASLYPPVLRNANCHYCFAALPADGNLASSSVPQEPPSCPTPPATAQRFTTPGREHSPGFWDSTCCDSHGAAIPRGQTVYRRARHGRPVRGGLICLCCGDVQLRGSGAVQTLLHPFRDAKAFRT